LNRDSVERLINQKLDTFKLDLILDIKEMISDHCSKSLDCVADVEANVQQPVKPIYRRCTDIIFDCVPRDPFPEGVLEAEIDDPHGSVGIYNAVLKIAPEFNRGTISPTLGKLRVDGLIHSKAVTMKTTRKGRPVLTTGFVYWRD
jgi:hypothetical protein